MKNLVNIFVLVFAFTLTTQAQKKGKEKRPQLSVEQHTILAVKKMTLALDLSEKQQNQIMPLIKAQATAKKEAMTKRKAMRENNTKPSADEIFAMQNKMLDNQIAMRRSMKDILNTAQFEKFEKMAKSRKMKEKKMMKKMMKAKKHKSKKEHSEKKHRNN